MRLFQLATISLAIFICVPNFDSNPTFAMQELSQEGKNQKAIHDFLFDDFLKDRKTEFRGNGTNRGLKEVTILDKPRVVRHGDQIELPKGAEKVAGLFRHFAFHGEGLDQIDQVIVFPFSPDKAPPRSAQLKEFYRVQMPSIPLTDKPFEPIKILVQLKDESATCRINDLVFIAQKQIPPEFDSIPYRDLGSDQPREKVTLQIDTDHELSIAGSTQLHRERWFRMHEIPGGSHESFQNWAAERNFLPGRGAFKFNPAITRYPKETLQERNDKPGAADLTFFDRYDAGGKLVNAIPKFRENTFSMCFNDWPEFMTVPLEGRGTPLPEYFDDAADLAAAFVADQVKDAGYTATWWEVKNESTVKSEWAHHWQEKQGIDGWGLLADFHSRVAKAIHQKTPGVKVGGPSSAYMQVQVKDFGLFRNQARFIEETRGHIDFFSHHFYENALMLGAHERRGMGYSNYLLGRYEAILDMLRAQMHKVDHVLPILITETGSLQNGRKPSDNWLRLVAWSAYLNKSMQRPDQIDLFIPFIFQHMPWNPISGDAAFTPKTDREKHYTIDDFERTTVANFFELWRDFDGNRLPVEFNRDWLDVVAVHQGKRISLAVTNMGGQQIAIDLSGVAKKLGAIEARQTRLNYHKGEVVFEPEHSVDVAAIPVDVNETTVIRLVLPKPLNPSGSIEMERWYAHDTAVKSKGESLTFKVNVDHSEQIKSAKLLLGLHARGLKEIPIVKLNGKHISIDVGDAKEFTEFFAPIDMVIPASLLKDENLIEITAEKQTTVTSVQILSWR